MTIRNPNWYDLNSMRSWPFEHEINGLDHSAIADIHLRFPRRYGYRAAMTAWSSTEHLVTAVFSTELDVPIASVSLVRPVEEGRVYLLQPLEPGVAGWIVFGDGIDTARGSLSLPVLDGLIQTRSAFSYPDAALRAVRMGSGTEWMSGIVRLQPGNDISIAREIRQIAGQTVEAIVFRLNLEEGRSAGRNLLDEYRGPCQGRPESYTCKNVEPLEFINNVSPDCEGRILLEFRGCAVLSRLEGDECGVVVDCGYSLDDACRTEERLPDPCGRLPNEYRDLCAEEEISSCVDPFPELR